jgi:chaperonin GroES
MALRADVDKIRPLGDRVLVRPHKPEEKSKGGVHLPQTAQLGQQGYLRWGTVIAVGAGKRSASAANGKRQALDVKKGDEIIYSHFTSFEAGPDTDIEELAIVYESDIAAVKVK